MKITCLLVCQVRPPDGVTCGSRWPGLTFLEVCFHLSLQRVTCVAGSELMRAGKSPACFALSDSACLQNAHRQSELVGGSIFHGGGQNFFKRKCDAREGELHWAAHRLLRKMFDNSLHRNVREVGLFRLGKRDACDPILERIKLMVKACYIEGCPRRTWVALVDGEEITLDTWNIKVNVFI